MPDAVKEARVGWCPSIRPDWPTDGKMQVFGIVTGTVERPEVQYIEPCDTSVEELTALAEPVTPMEIFRTTTPCHREGCSYWQGHCTVAEKLVALKPPTSPLPACTIRPRCQWWKDSGPDICYRCPQLASDRIVGEPQPDDKIVMVP